LIFLCSGDFGKFSCTVESVASEQFNFVGTHASENLQLWRLLGFFRSSFGKGGLEARQNGGIEKCGRFDCA
jgi:hypothetical protein